MVGGQATFEAYTNNTASSWWKDKSLRKNVFYCMGCMLCPFYLGYDQTLLNGLQAIPIWNKFFDSPSGNRLGLISAAIFLPGIVFGFPAEWLCNHYGRRWCIYIGSILIIIGAIFNALAQNEHQFIGSRVILGAGGSMTKVGAPAMVQELAHPRLRSPLGTMYYGFYYSGSFSAGILCIIGLYIKSNWGWRLPCLFMIVGPIAVLAILITSPESPRYLVKKGKIDQAHDVLAKQHANGDLDDPLVQWELQEIQIALEMETIQARTSYFDFLRTPGNRKRFLILQAMAWGVNWNGVGIVSYYLAPALRAVGVREPTKLLGINAGLAIWNLIVSLFCGRYADKFGRRPLWLTSTAGCIISYAFVMALNATFAKTGQTNYGLAAVPFLFLFYGSYCIAWTPLNYSYLAEILPYDLRAKGLALLVTFQNVGNAFNQFVNPIALAAISWRYYGVYIAIDVCFFILIWFVFPETKRMTIEEIGFILDYGVKEGREKAAEAMESHLRDRAERRNEKDQMEHVDRNVAQASAV